MTKSIVLFTFFFATTVLAGCGGEVSLYRPADNGTGGDCTVEPETGCATSPYQWGDEVLYVCSGTLPLTEMNGFAFVQIGSFYLVNYHTLWLNSITRICVKSVGPTSLDTVSQINFDSPFSSPGQVVLQAPWQEDGKICADIEIPIGAESTAELTVFIASYPTALPTGAQYQFEIEQPSDITIGEVEVELTIDGDFPVKTEVVTIVDG